MFEVLEYLSHAMR